MKKITYKPVLAFIFLFSLTFFFACDKIDAPYTKDTSGGGTDTGTIQVVKKVLLEEFTGHACVNCPAAHELAASLAEEYDGKLSIISIHAGYQAEPSGELPEDFTNEVGDEIFAAYNDPFNPMGLVDRNEDAASLSSSWAAKIAEEMALPVEFSIVLTPDYHNDTRVFDLTLKMKAMAAHSGNLRFCAFITENDIIAPQKNNDSNVGPTPIIEDYHHNHVLRGSMNGTWGDLLAEGDTPEGKEFSKDLSLTIPQEWAVENCHVVAFVFDENTKRILQVEEVALTD